MNIDGCVGNNLLNNFKNMGDCMATTLIVCSAPQLRAKSQ